jgi:polyhydroxyalkanoate synthase
VGSTDTEDICLRTGHIGIYVSGKCQREFAPKIADWLGERDVQRKRPERAVAAKAVAAEAVAAKAEAAKAVARRPAAATQAA